MDSVHWTLCRLGVQWSLTGVHWTMSNSHDSGGLSRAPQAMLSRLKRVRDHSELLWPEKWQNVGRSAVIISHQVEHSLMTPLMFNLSSFV